MNFMKQALAFFAAVMTLTACNPGNSMSGSVKGTENAMPNENERSLVVPEKLTTGCMSGVGSEATHWRQDPVSGKEVCLQKVDSVGGGNFKVPKLYYKGVADGAAISGPVNGARFKEDAQFSGTANLKISYKKGSLGSYAEHSLDLNGAKYLILSTDTSMKVVKDGGERVEVATLDSKSNGEWKIIKKSEDLGETWEDILFILVPWHMSTRTISYPGTK